MSFCWPPQDPSPSPPQILSNTNHERIVERSPSPPWGRSPSPPLIYIRMAEYRRAHSSNKKSRWDQVLDKQDNINNVKHNIDNDIIVKEESDIEMMADFVDFTNFDPRISIKSGNKSRRRSAFSWIEQNTFVKQAQIWREKEMRDFQQRSRIRARVDVREISMKNSINDSLIHEIIDSVPDMEWWDMNLFIDDKHSEMILNSEMITSLIEYPKILRAQFLKEGGNECTFFLTKKEKRKMRRIDRKIKHDEITDRIRLGLLEPPEPRLRIANIMRVLGNSAITDPSAIEFKARAQTLKRKMKHELMNEMRKLSTDQRREKKRKKLMEDVSRDGVIVNVFSVPHLKHHRKAQYKIWKNAQQLNLTGVCLSIPRSISNVTVVIVEGGPKGISKYQRLILHRIQWNIYNISKSENIVEEEIGAKAELVWTGTNAKRSFSKFVTKEFETEIDRQSFCSMHNILSYLDYVQCR